MLATRLKPISESVIGPISRKKWIQCSKLEWIGSSIESKTQVRPRANISCKFRQLWMSKQPPVNKIKFTVCRLCTKRTSNWNHLCRLGRPIVNLIKSLSKSKSAAHLYVKVESKHPRKCPQQPWVMRRMPSDRKVRRKTMMSFIFTWRHLLLSKAPIWSTQRLRRPLACHSTKILFKS